MMFGHNVNFECFAAVLIVIVCSLWSWCVNVTCICAHVQGMRIEACGMVQYLSRTGHAY
jgi:hypothetical protein